MPLTAYERPPYPKRDSYIGLTKRMKNKTETPKNEVWQGPNLGPDGSVTRIIVILS